MNEPQEQHQQDEQKIERASFIATFPNNQNAISFHGAGGLRIQLDIPENDLPNALALTMWRDRAMRVTITPLKKDLKTGWKE